MNYVTDIVTDDQYIPDQNKNKSDGNDWYD